MKMYFYGLLVLFLFSMLNRGLAIWMGVPPVFMVQYVADAVFFMLCLRVCYGAAFNRRFFEPGAIRLIYWGVMLLGIVSTALIVGGEYVGLPDFNVHPINVVMSFLPYPMFAMPCVLLERLLRMDEEAGETGADCTDPAQTAPKNDPS